MQATVRMALVNQFKHKLEEGKSVTLRRYSLGKIQPNGSVYGFDFRDYNAIIQLQQEEDGQFDLDNHDKNGKPGKKKPLTFVDAEGNELKCTFWGAFAQQFSDFLSTCSDHVKMYVQNGYHGTKLFAFDL
nr:hypothetical protein [Tanacetum cinerariifolium]